MPCVLRHSCSLEGKTMRSSSPVERRLGMEAQQRIQDRKRAFRHAELWPRGADARERPATCGPLCPAAVPDATICVATWASVSVRRPKGVVG